MVSNDEVTTGSFGTSVSIRAPDSCGEEDNSPGTDIESVEGDREETSPFDR